MAGRSDSLGSVRIFAFTAALAVSSAALAQAAFGGLSGTVVDATTQAPLADAQVTARSPALLGEQTVTTDQDGNFEMTLLPAGSYDLLVKHDGFQPFAPGGLVLKGHRVRIRLALLPTPAAPPPPPPVVENALEFNERTMSPPSMISGPDIEYSEEALDRGIEGTMQVRCVVTVAGAVRRCRVLKGLAYMDQAVLGALEARKYRPATAQGKPVDVFYTFSIRLKLPQ